MSEFKSNSMFQEEREARIYCQIKNGKIGISCKKDTPKATVFKYDDDQGNTNYSYWRLYGSITGKLVEVRRREGKFQEELCVVLTNSAGELVELQMPLFGGFAMDFLKRLPNTDLEKDIIINPFKIKKEGTENSHNYFCLIKQKNENGKEESVKYKYTKDEPNGLPAWKKIKVKGKDTWDTTDTIDFLMNVVEEEINPVIKNNTSTETYVEAIEEQEDGVFEENDSEEIQFTSNPDDIEGEKPPF